MCSSMLARQRGSIARRGETLCLKSYSRRHVVVCAAKTTMQLDTTKAPQNSEVSILVPMTQPLAPVPATQNAFGVGKTGALAAAALAVGFILNKLRKRWVSSC